MENSTLSRLPHSTIEITMRREWRINQKHTFVLKHRTRSRSFPITFRDISAHAKRVFVTSYQRFYYNIYKKPSYLRNVCIGCLFYRGRLSSAVSSKDSYIQFSPKGEPCKFTFEQLTDAFTVSFNRVFTIKYAGMYQSVVKFLTSSNKRRISIPGNNRVQIFIMGKFANVAFVRYSILLAIIITTVFVSFAQWRAKKRNETLYVLSLNDE